MSLENQTVPLIRAGQVPSPDSLQHRVEIGPFLLLARFSSSAANEVYLAVRKTAFGYARRAVVKLVRRSDAAFSRHRDRLLDEARAVAGLDHPNVVNMLDWGEDEEISYLALEYIDGTDLRELLGALYRKKARLPEQVCLFIAIEVLRGLEHAHVACDADQKPLHLIHRDVTPSNILLSREGHVVLTDFGMVRMRDRQQDPTGPGLVKGKFRYLAPEYVSQEEIDHRVDIYGIGVTLFELLIASPWIQGKTSIELMRKIVREGIPLEKLDEVGVHEEIRAIVARAVTRDLDQRYATAQSMREALERHLLASRTYTSASHLAAVAKGLASP